MRYFLCFLTLFAVSSCGERSASDMANQQRAAIAPQQFALVPCRKVFSEEHPPCSLLAAGGKYYLMGAPEGALASLLEDEIELLDGILLFSLLPDQIEGLDSVRNATWRAGRSAPLLVAGPEGTTGFGSAIDSAFETSDAELFAKESPAGGFDASLLRPVEIVFGTNAGTEVANTGDLVIIGFYAPSGQIAYRAEYSGRIAAIGMCGGCLLYTSPSPRDS